MRWSLNPIWAASAQTPSVSPHGCFGTAMPRRGKRTQPRVLTLGSVCRQAARPERAQERIRTRYSHHRNHIRLQPIPNLPPLQGGSVLLCVYPGLKPWAESCRPFGTSLPPLYHSITPPLHYSTTPPLHHSINSNSPLQPTLAGLVRNVKN
jgi:hypothetical protein